MTEIGDNASVNQLLVYTSIRSTNAWKSQPPCTLAGLFRACDIDTYARSDRTELFSLENRDLESILAQCLSSTSKAYL
jgi:hypothetical protein